MSNITIDEIVKEIAKRKAEAERNMADITQPESALSQQLGTGEKETMPIAGENKEAAEQTHAHDNLSDKTETEESKFCFKNAKITYIDDDDDDEEITGPDNCGLTEDEAEWVREKLGLDYDEDLTKELINKYIERIRK